MVDPSRDQPSPDNPEDASLLPLFLRYFDGELNLAELHEFNQLLRNDPRVLEPPAFPKHLLPGHL